MPNKSNVPTPSEPSLDDVLAQYIVNDEAGSPLDRQVLLSQHPQFADELRDFFANRDRMQRLSEPLRGRAESNRPSETLGKVRYFGDYELLEEVAAGGMGIIYKARQRSLNRIVAVKMILKGTLAREDDVKRFRAEAEAAANLQHPAIVAIHEVGLHEGQHYFSMDFVDGHSLAELPREQPLSAHQAAEYIRDAAEAVHYAHQQGTLHRDLKPSNILIDRQCRVRITDFGLAKRIEGNSDLTLSGQILGTPSYMPPEQALGKRSLIAAASDTYSLGAVLYELLTGRPPFRGESPAETLRQVESLDPLSPRLLNPATPRDLETICLKCLEKEPHKRYGTAQLLADDLGRYLRGEPIVARPISRVAHAWRWCKRNPVVSLLSASIAVLLLVTSVASTAGYLSTRRALDSEMRQRRAEDKLLVKEATELVHGPHPNFALAEERLTDVLERRLEDASTLLYRSRVRWELGLTQRALDDARRSVELQPADNASAWLLIVAAAMELGDEAQALAASQHLQEEAAASSESLAAKALVAPLDPDSVHLLSKAIESEPFEPRYLAMRGATSYHLMVFRTSKHHYDQAVGDLERFFQSQPFSWRARERLVASYVLFHFLADDWAKPLDRAKVLLDAWLAGRPDDLVGLALLARWHMAQEHWTEAAVVCERGRKLDAADPELALISAEILLGQEEYRKAAEAFDAAEKTLNDGRPRLLLPASRTRIAALRGRCEIELTAPTKAETEFPVFQMSPTGHDDWTFFDWEALVAAHQIFGNRQQAARGYAGGSPVSGHARLRWFCQEWQVHAPECSGPPDALASLTTIPMESIELLTVALQRAPSLRWAYFHRGKMRTKLQNSDREAIADFEVLVRLAPDQPQGLWELAQLRLTTTDPKLRDLAWARNLALRIVDRDPRRHDAWHLMAQAEQRMGRYEESLKAIETALGVAAQSTAYLVFRGDVLTDLSRFSDARRAYDDALQTVKRTNMDLDAIAARLALPAHGNTELYEHARSLLEEARAFSPQAKADLQASPGGTRAFATGIVLYRLGRWAEALADLELSPSVLRWDDSFNGDRYGRNDRSFFRAMALWQLGRRDEAWTQYQEAVRTLLKENGMAKPAQGGTDLRREAARLIGSQLDQEPIVRDVATRQTGPRDYPQWGGWAGRNNVGQGDRSPTDWDPGEFDRKTGAWNREKSRNIKWVANLGSQTYGNPTVANGKIFVGTNNSHGYLKRYPSDVDLGVLLAIRESDGAFLWQHSCEKLSTGRVHDWPLVGLCSSPLVEGNRLWVVTNRGEVVCLDTEGFRDGEDDGPVQGLKEPLFRVRPSVHSEFEYHQIPRRLDAALSDARVKLPSPWRLKSDKTDRWLIMESDERGIFQLNKPHLQVDLVGEELQVRRVDPQSQEAQPVVVTISDRLWDGIGTPAIIESLRGEFSKAGMDLPPNVEVRTVVPEKEWAFEVVRDEGRMEVVVSQGDWWIVAARTDFTTSKDQQQSDIVWSLDMMKELGVSQHNMATCAPTAWKDTLFICTSNGVDEGHITIPAPDAPSFMALDKHTGKVLWTDNSPGKNIQHGQWSAPAVGVFAGVPQVIFGGGDGWMYSFHAEEWKDGKPILLWKFDVNPKDSLLELGGRGTRNEPFAVPVVYDGLVYVTTGQDPEHGEGNGYLWCIDPTRRGDVSPQLAVTVTDRNTVLPHKRKQAVVAADGEMAIDNPNSAAVWMYSRYNAKPGKKLGFADQFHRSISSVVIKDDILIACDFSGLVHCLNAKTGQRYWTADLLAAVWGTPLIVGDRAYVPDEDGDIAIFSLHADPDRSTQPLRDPGEEDRQPLLEINMGNSVYSTPVFANGILYIANKDHLFAIVEPDAPPTNTESSIAATPTP